VLSSAKQLQEAHQETTSRPISVRRAGKSLNQL